MLRKPILFAILAAIPALSAFAILQSGTSHTVADVSSIAFTGPTNPSSSEVSEFLQAQISGEPIPTGWAVTAFEGRVKAIDSGIALPSGERSWTVTVVDDTGDLSTATVYLNDQAVYTATRANGGIVDRGSQSIATLPVLVPPAGQSFSLKATWVANDGTTVREASGLMP